MHNMMLKPLVSVSLYTLLCSSAMATSDSWYVINNYEGMIGKNPVHLSLQSYAFGGQTTVKGSYYYDKYRSPIPLYGNKTATSIVLCEVNTDKEYREHIEEGVKYDTSTCPLKLAFGGDNLQGTWQNKKTSLTVILQHTASMDATPLAGNTKQLIDIPFWGQSDEHSFIGVYEKKGNDISINNVKVLDKHSGNVVQVIDPQLHNCTFGFYMTAIYQNIEKVNSPSGIVLNCYSTGSDNSVFYGFSKASHAYLVIN